MILTGSEIKKQVKAGKIKISPFSVSRITTNSYDLTLGKKVLKYTSKIIDPKKKAEFKMLEIPKEGLLMKPSNFLLGATAEKVGSDYFVPIIHARSGIARMGLFVHVTADLIDIGSFGNLTLQLFTTLPVKIFSGMKIAQVSFWVPRGKIILYQGKYQHSNGPRPSLAYRDFQ